MVDVNPAGLTTGATLVDGIAQGLHLEVGGEPVWADYLSVAGASAASASVKAVTEALAQRFTTRAEGMRTSSAAYVNTDVDNGAEIRL